MPKKTEHSEQTIFMSWCNIMARGQYPELGLMYAIVNERKGARAGSRAKAQGQKAGMPDLCLPVARGGYFGLYLEHKIGRNKPTQKQIAKLDALGEQGYLAIVCYGFEGLKDETEKYLELPPTAAAS